MDLNASESDRSTLRAFQWLRMNGGFVLHEILHPADYRLNWHSHEWTAFILTLSGSSTEIFAGIQFQRTRNTVLVRPAGLRHADAISPQGTKCFLIEFDESLMAAIPQLREVLQRPSFHRVGSMIYLAQRVYREWLQNDSASQLAIHALIFEMGTHLIRAGKTRPDSLTPYWLRLVKQRLDEGFEETPSLMELSSIAGVHPSHLARKFRSCYKKSIGEYLRQRRVDVAIDLLVGSNLSLTEIALATGFAHHAHFTTTFRRQTGVPPSEYRGLRRLASGRVNRSSSH